MKKIVLTWWTYTWKTTLLKEFKKQGFICLDEVAQNNMKLLSSILKDKYLYWRKENFLEFQKMNIFDDLKRYLSVLKNENIIFFDRWVFDWVASLKRENIEIPDYIDKLFSNISYDIAFVIEPLKEHKTREYTWRVLNKEMSVKWAKYIENEYKDRWVKVIKVDTFSDNKEESIKKRVQFILNNI